MIGLGAVVEDLKLFDLHRGGNGAVGIFGVVEEGEEFVILPVCNRIELVRVGIGRNPP